MTATMEHGGVRWWSVLLTLAMLGGAIAFFGYMVSSRQEPPVAESTEAIDRVLVVEARQAKIGRQWVGFGTAQATETADVPARVGATVDSIGQGVEAGARVAAGQLLVALDESDYRRAAAMAGENLRTLEAEASALEVEALSLQDRLLVAEQELDLAKADEARVRRASDEGGATAREVDQVRLSRLAVERAVLVLRQSVAELGPRRAGLAARIEAQRAAMARAEADLERCRITSPISGTIQQFPLELGEAVAPGQMVARVVDPHRVEVALALPADARSHLQVGDAAECSVGGRPIGTARVSRIAPEDDPSSRTLTAWIEFVRASDADPPAPGAFVEAMVTSSNGELRTILPRTAVRRERVLLLEANQLRAVPVTVAHAYTGGLEGAPGGITEWLVLEPGLPANATVALDASRAYRPGRKVEGLPAQRP